MLLNHKNRKNEKGFAIALALLMLVAMSLMGASLMLIAASDHKKMVIKILNSKLFMPQKRE